MKKQVICLNGPNACGKGFTCDYLKYLGAQIISTSNALELAKKTDHELAETINHHKNILKINVPCEIAIEAVGKRFDEVSILNERLFILDALGRTRQQVRSIPERIHKKTRNKEIPVGFAFLKLPLEEVQLRAQKRVEKALKMKETPRSEDDPETVERRFWTYHEEQEGLIEEAQNVSGWVSIYDLSKYTTLQVASMLFASAENSDSSIIARRLQSHFGIEGLHAS